MPKMAWGYPLGVGAQSLLNILPVAVYQLMVVVVGSFDLRLSGLMKQLAPEIHVIINFITWYQFL